jgi:hypothetical protein
VTKKIHEQLEPFAPQYLGSYGNSGDIFAWVGDTVYETIANGIRRTGEDDRNVARNGLKSFGLVRPNGDQSVGPQRHESSGQPREARNLTVA